MPGGTTGDESDNAATGGTPDRHGQILIDFAIVAAFVIYSITVGFLSRKQASGISRSTSSPVVASPARKPGLSMAATQFAADTPLLVMGLMAVGGVFSLWRLWIYGLAFLMMGFFPGGAVARAGVLTDAELAMIRYSARGALALRGLEGRLLRHRDQLRRDGLRAGGGGAHLRDVPALE